MGNTTGGLPFPEPAADFNQGANDIKALALAIEARGGGLLLQRGSTPVTTDSAGNASVPYPTAFKPGTQPTVTIMMNVAGVAATAILDTTVSSNTLFRFLLIGLWPVNPPAPQVNKPCTAIWIAVGTAP